MNLAVSIAIGLTVVGSALVAVPALVVEWAKRSSPEVVFSVGTDEKLVALTIDDGPSASTAEILEVLDAHGAEATFFVIGDEVEAHPKLAREIVARGHELGHHMMQDRPSRDLGSSEFQHRFDQMDAILEDYGGSRVFRPGSGWYDDAMVALARDRGYTTVLGSVYPFDAHLPWGGFHRWYIRQKVQPGSILVLHEGQGRGVRTVEVLRTVLPELRDRGYRVVSVSTLLELDPTESWPRRP